MWTCRALGGSASARWEIYQIIYSGRYKAHKIWARWMLGERSADIARQTLDERPAECARRACSSMLGGISGVMYLVFLSIITIVFSQNIVLLNVSDKLYKFIVEQQNSNRIPLCINPSSAAFKSFARQEGLCKFQPNLSI